MKLQNEDPTDFNVLALSEAIFGEGLRFIVWGG